AEREDALVHPARDRPGGEREGRRAGGAVVVYVEDRDAGKSEIVDGALTARAVAVDVAAVRGLHSLEVDLRVRERGAGGLHGHDVVFVASARLLALRHADADDIDPTS